MKVPRNNLHRDNLSILLMQIRGDEETLQEEFLSFVQFSGLKEEQITPINVYTTRQFEPNIIDKHDALFIGGSSDATVQDEITYDFIPACNLLIRYCLVNDIPVLASCFGFQLALKELGAEVIVDKPNMELGIHEIKLTEEARHDKLLSGYPNTFFVVSGHQERASSLPANAILLASSEKCPYHLVKFKGRRFYCTQFHPEVDREILIARITRYQRKYLDSPQALQTVIDEAIHETPLSNQLVRDFIDRVILNQTEKGLSDKREHIPNPVPK